MPSSPTSSSSAYHCNGGLIFYQFLQRKLGLIFVSLFLFLLPTTTTVVDATTILCNTPEDCVFPQTLSCPDFIESNTFYGTCCSLSDDPALGNCVVTISNGHCIWENQQNSGIQYLSEFNQPCPQSDYDPFVTQPPANPPPDDSTTDPPVDVPATPPPPLPPPPPPSPPPPTALPITQQPSISPVEVANPTIQPTMFPTRSSILTEICGGSTTTTTDLDDGDGEMCEMLLKQTCSEFISQNNFVGTCCSLEHIAETGQCIVRISDGHCFWEPKNGSCDPLSGANCGELGGIFYKSLSTESCPPSGFDVFATPTGIEKKEEKTRILTIIWVSILLVVVFVRILLCFAKCYADKKNMEDEEELLDEYQGNGSHDVYSSKSKSSSTTTSLASNTPPRIKRQSIDDDDNIIDPENGSNNIGIQNIELVDRNQQHVLNQHKAYFEEVLAGFEEDVIGRRCLETQSQEGGADRVSAATAAIGKEIT